MACPEPRLSAFTKQGAAPAGSIDADVVAGIAHDINNVLTVVRLHTDSVLSGPLTLPQQRELRCALDATGRGAALAQQLVALVRNLTEETLICELNELVRSTAESLTRVIGPEIALVTELSSSPSPVRARAGQVDRILLNLVLNARDAMPHGGRLTVSVQQAVIPPASTIAEALRPGRYARLLVRDTGLGMSPELKASIFDPFFTTKSTRGGTGLGLPVVLQEVRELLGTIQVESEPTQGSTFIIYLPLATETARSPQDGQ